mgnify:CR=1 FL=1
MGNPKDGYLIVDKDKALSHLRVLKMLAVKSKGENNLKEYTDGYIDAINDAIDYIGTFSTIGEAWDDISDGVGGGNPDSVGPETAGDRLNDLNGGQDGDN